MLTRIVLMAAVLAPQIAAAADLRQPYRHHEVRRPRPVVEAEHVVRCTTKDFVIFAYSDCGQGFDPLVFSGY